jgi:hypothetical protein
MASKYVEVDFGPLKVKFFALTLGQLQELEEEMQAMSGVAKGANPFDPARFAKLVRIYTASAKRGDPSVTEEQVRQIVDLDNLAEVNAAVLGQIGMHPTASNGGASVDPTRPLTGAVSTPA